MNCSKARHGGTGFEPGLTVQRSTHGTTAPYCTSNTQKKVGRRRHDSRVNGVPNPPAKCSLRPRIDAQGVHVVD